MQPSTRSERPDIMTRDWKAELERLDIDSVVAHDALFKAQLGIGEEAYTSLKIRNFFRRALRLSAATTGGGAVAASPLVATTFFPAGGILGLLGLGAAATPIGWVIAGAVGGGMTWVLIEKLLDGMDDGKVEKVPKYINKPVDRLAIGIFGLIAPLGLHIASADNKVTSDEFHQLSAYFSDRWGYNPEFVQAGLLFYSESMSAPARIRAELKKCGMEHHAHLIREFNGEDYARSIATFVVDNKDCNREVMSKRIVGFLRELIRADNKVDPREEETLGRIETILLEHNSSGFGRLWSSHASAAPARRVDAGTDSAN